MNRLLLVTVLSCTLAACAGREAKRASHAGDVEASPSLEVLPALDVSDRALTREMRKARALGEESMSFGFPRALREESGMKATWAEKELLDWLRKKHQLAEEAKAALERAGAQNSRQSVLASAIIGLVYEEAALRLFEVPPPSDLPFGLQGISVFREVMQQNASVCLNQAQEAYAACTERAQKLPGLTHFGPFCSGRAAKLPKVVDPLAPPG